MRRIFALLKVVRQKLIVVHNRLTDELFDIDSMMRHQIDRSSDDPRTGGGPPMVGIL